MADTPRKLIAGNWKMNGLRRGAEKEARALAKRCGQARGRGAAEVLVCPPATLIAPLAAVLKGTPVRLGGQDCAPAPSGAHTGDVSAEMLADAGCGYVIVGHSERRADHGETDAQVRTKAAAAHRAGLTAIICIGETGAERRRGQTLEIIGRQLRRSLPPGATADNSVIAYEPVWAIGTGLTPSVADVAEVHGFLRRRLARRLGEEGRRLRLLYGGSVKASNAAELLAVDNVDGALVGGASLTARDFWPIVRAAG